MCKLGRNRLLQKIQEQGSIRLVMSLFRANNLVNVSPSRENSSPDSNVVSDSMTSHPSSPNPTEGETIRGSLEVQGVVKAFEFSQLSDLRLKTNISDISDALKIVSSLQGRRYEWKNGTETEGTGGNRVIGLIAQEVRKVAPEVKKFLLVNNNKGCS